MTQKKSDTTPILDFPSVQEMSAMFTAKSIPPGAPDIQHIEMRKAFIIGFYTCLSGFNHLGYFPENIVERVTGNWIKEAEKFGVPPELIKGLK